MPRTGQLFVISAPSGAGKTSLVKALLAARAAAGGVGVAHHAHSARARGPRPRLQLRKHRRVRAPGRRAARSWSTPGCSTTITAPAASRSARIWRPAAACCWRSTGRARARCATACPTASPYSYCRPRARCSRSACGRAAPTAPQVIARRLADAAADMSHCLEFDYAVVNDGFEQAVAELLTHHRRPRQRAAAPSARKSRPCWRSLVA